MAIRYLIVDDEAPGRANLRLAMDAHPGWHLTGESESAAAARAVLAGQEVDVVFLDIQMPGESGLVLARELSRLREPRVLAVTLLAALLAGAAAVAFGPLRVRVGRRS